MANNNLDNFESIKFNKVLSHINKISKISEYFHHNKSECHGAIKQAHSIQKNGRLSIIEGDIDGEKKIYTFASFKPSNEALIAELSPVGKKSASTFFGFCDYHDSVLFSPIENHPFDDSLEHLFLHSYRSFAHSYHKRKESLKGMQLDDKYDFGDDLIKAHQLSMIDYEKSKNRLDYIIENKLYEELFYITHVINRSHPVACASVISPIYYYNNKIFNESNDPNFATSEIMLTVLPEVEYKNETIIILACFSNDERGMVFLDQLDTLNDFYFERAISSLIIANVENTFFAPALWEALGPKGKKDLLSDLNFIMEEMYSNTFVLTKFFHSKVNLFESKFSSKRLGLINR